MAEAEQALTRADQRGHAAAAFNLGVLLEERGDIDGAAAAFVRADERGDADGALEVARLLIDHDQMAEAEQALTRADQRGHAAAAANLAALREYRFSAAERAPVAEAADPGPKFEPPAAETMKLAPEAALSETAELAPDVTPPPIAESRAPGPTAAPPPISEMPEPTPDVAPSGAITPEPIADDAETVTDAELTREGRKRARVGRTPGIRRRRWAAVALGVLVIGIAFAGSTKFGSNGTKTQPSSITTNSQPDRATATHSASLSATPGPATRKRTAPAHKLAHIKISPALQAKAKVRKKKVTPARKPSTLTTSQSPTGTVSTQPAPPARGAITPVHWSPPHPTTSGSSPSSRGSGAGGSTPSGSHGGTSGSRSTHAGSSTGGSRGGGSSNHGGAGRGRTGALTGGG
jgi:hypothetical protein